MEQLRLFLSESKRILADWDAYSDQHSGPGGWPLDEHAYGRRASRRDADTWRAFNRIRTAARHLLHTAETQLSALPPTTVQPRWAWQLAALSDALDHLEALHARWLETRTSLPAEARPGTDTYGLALAEHHADAWSYLDTWAIHAQAILDIHTAAQQAPRPWRPPRRRPPPRQPTGPRRRGGNPVPGTVPVDFVAPRHLAGGGDPTWVTVPLHRACGWSHGHDPLTPRVLLSSPDQKTLLRLEPDPEGRWWEIRHTGGAGHKPWLATFDGHTPVEAIAAFTDALTAPSAATGETDPYEPLRQTGWEPAGRGDGLVSPDGTAHVEHLVEETTDCWFATTRPGTDHAPHWQAYFHGDTPLHLVTAFSRALCDETPVMRRNPLMRASARTSPLITRQPREVPAAEVAFALENRVRQLTAQHTGPHAPAPPHHRRPTNRRTR